MAAGNSGFEVFVELSSHRLGDSGVGMGCGLSHVHWDVRLNHL